MKLLSKKNILANGCSVILIVLIILGVLYILYTRQEGFLSGAPFPGSLTGGLLAPPNGNYKMYPKGHCLPGLSENTYKTEWKLYPYTPMSSYAQITNNKEYWASPSNGTCAPPEICGKFYQKRKIIRPPPVPPPSNYPPGEVRVNYYIADP